MMQPTAGPTLLGIDVVWAATVLSGIATLAVLTAIGLALFAAAGAVQRLTEKGRPEGRPQAITTR